MYETEHRQIDEIDEIRDKLKASQAVSDHLADVRKELEAIVADLRGQLKFSQDESQGRKEHIEKQDEVLSQMKADWFWWVDLAASPTFSYVRNGCPLVKRNL